MNWIDELKDDFVVKDEGSKKFDFEDFKDKFLHIPVLPKRTINALSLCSSFAELSERSCAPLIYACYASNVLKSRWEEVEDVIERNPVACVCYLEAYPDFDSDEVIKIIKQKPLSVARYAICKKLRWVEMEYFISEDAYASYEYAKHLLNGRFLKAENTIKSDKWARTFYENEFNVKL